MQLRHVLAKTYAQNQGNAGDLKLVRSWIRKNPTKQQHIFWFFFLLL